MSRTLHLSITTPFEVLVDADIVRALRAEDESGSFGILPGHVDFLTALPVSVVRWQDNEDVTHFCALRGGVLTVSANGSRINIACRQGMLGDDLAKLSSDVAALQEAQADAERRARIGEMQMHARAVRQLIGLLNPHHAAGHGDGSYGSDAP
jgi:F-type H+-transporting ATPase subunit epsilon